MRRSFGRGPSVRLFTLGTMRAIDSAEQMYSVVKVALSAGVNHIETAPAYGPAEKFLGKTLIQLNEENKFPKGGWIITNKLKQYWAEITTNNKDNIWKYFEVLILLNNKCN